MAIYPGLTLTDEEVDTLVDYTTRMGLALQVKGLMNIQYVIVGGSPYRSPGMRMEKGNKSSIYVLEVNPRASRTVPFLSKVTGVPMVKLATKVMLGRDLDDLGYGTGLWKKQNLVGVKSPVFSMSKLAGVDTYLGPEMKSTGEVMGIDVDVRGALAKSLMASGLMLKHGGSVLLSISDDDKADSVSMIRDLSSSGCKLYATEGTAKMIEGLGLPVTMITKKLSEGHPNVLDVIMDGTVNSVVNTAVTVERAPLRDGFEIRRAAVEKRIPCFTSLDTARAAVESLISGSDIYNVRPRAKYISEGKD